MTNGTAPSDARDDVPPDSVASGGSFLQRLGTSTKMRQRSDGLGEVEIEHRVTMGETSGAGFVYFLAFIEWQGRYREEFGIEFMSGYLKSIATGEIGMLTSSCSCEYYGELYFGDLVRIRMAVPWVRLHFSKGLYSYYRVEPEGERLVARGEQVWSSAALVDGVYAPAPWPKEFVEMCRKLGADVSRALVD